MTYTLENRASARAEKVLRFTAVLVAVAMFMMLSLQGFAAATDGASQAVQEGIRDGAEQLYNIMTAIVVPVAVVIFAWAALKVFFGGERGMDQAKKTMLIVVAVLALVFLAPVIVKQISQWFLSNGSVNKDTVFSTLVQ